MVDQKNTSNTNSGIANSPALLSDETIDELGYARFTATSDKALPVPHATTLSTMVVTGPTKSPPPVLMPRPRPAIHPTLKLTNAFANPEPALSPTPSPSASLPDEYPEQPPSTYLTPPLAPVLKPVATPTPGGLSTTQQQQTKEEMSQQQQQQQQRASCGKTSPTTPSSPPPPSGPVISAPSTIPDNSNLNHHQISTKTTGMATQQQSNQSEAQETGQNQHSSTTASSNDDVRPHGSGVLVRKSGTIALTASTSAPLVPSPLVKSTLASQLSSSSSSSSSGSEKQQQQQQQENEKESHQQKHSQQEQKEQQHRQQRHLRKSLSTEQLSKSGQSDFSTQNHFHHQQQHVPFSGGTTRPAGVEKLIYSGGGKSSLQQLQQEYLLRQNGYLRRQVDALKFDNMESQRQHQELATRMKQLEIQLLEEKKRQTPQQHSATREPLMTTTNEYQHHHYYHHNVYAPLPPDMDHYRSSSEDEQQGDMEQETTDHWKERDNGGDHDTITKKRSGHQPYGTEDDNLPDQHRRQRPPQPHDRYEKSMEEGLSPDDKHYIERRHGFSPSGGIRIATTKKSQHPLMNQQKRPLVEQRRHSSHITPIPSTSDSVLQATHQQRSRQRHVTAPSLAHHYRGGGQQQQQQEQRGYQRQRSRSVPKNEHLHPSPRSGYRQQQQPSDQTMRRGKPMYIDDNGHHLGMFPPPPPHHFGHLDGADENMDMESDDEQMEAGFENDHDDGYYYGDDDNDDDDDDEDYLEELDYYRYHMTAPTAPGPPMVYYPPPPPPVPLPPPDAFFNDPYATMPPLHHAPPPPPPLTLHRRKSASALRPSRTGPQGFMDVMNPEHFERPLRPPMRRNWNHPQANHLRQLRRTPPLPQQQQHRRGYRGSESIAYGPRQQRGPPPPPTTTTTMSIAASSPRSGALADHHHLSRKPSAAMNSPRMTTLPLRRPMVTRGSSIGSYPGRA